MKNDAFFQETILPIISNPKMQYTRELTQHGNVSVFAHTLAVAAYSIKFAEKLRIRYDKNSLIRGALLHDFFLYDWHKTSNIGDGLHGFAHPYTALKNASAEFDLNEKERDMIRKHMWPLTITKIPRYRESWIICLIDKHCSLMETLHISRYNDETFISPAVLAELKTPERAAV